MSEFNLTLTIAGFFCSTIFALISSAVFRAKFRERCLSGSVLHGVIAALFIYSSFISAGKVIFSLSNFDRDVVLSASACFGAEDGAEYLSDGRCVFRHVRLQADAFETNFIVLETDDFKMLIRPELVQIIR